MSGKTSTSTQSVSIPPSVLAQYQTVNADAQQTAQTPFQTYSGQFVAPVNSTEQAGISQTQSAAQEAQPYYGAATSTLENAQAATEPYYGAATSEVGDALQTGNGLLGASLGTLGNTSTAAQSYNTTAGNSYAGAYDSAQPYNEAATGLAAAGAQAVNPTALTGQAINQYLSPYLGDVLTTESALLNQNNQQELSGELGNAIENGAFGGDRTGIAAANTAQQLELANANTYSNILNTGYQSALSTAEGQQQLGLSAAQANRAAIQNAETQIQGLGQQEYSQGMDLGTAEQGLGQQVYNQGLSTAQEEAALGQQGFSQDIAASQQEAGLGQDIYGTGAATSAALANLGSGAQSAADSGAQAELAAGQVAQQTAQAEDTAEYNQFLQQQSYPFQVDQFLANIAEGTGSLSGSTTTTTQPQSIFSDERLKEGVEKIGELFDGQPIYRYRYRGDPREQIGLLAQNVEKKHPEAVGLAAGFKTVDYGNATEEAAERGHFQEGGIAAGRPRRASGGGLDPYDEMMLSTGTYGPYATGGLYGAAASGSPRGGLSYVPAATLPVGRLAVAGAPPRPPPSALQQASDFASGLTNLEKGAQGLGALSKSIGNAVGLGKPSLNDADGDDSFGADIDADLTSGGDGYRRGGHIRRRGLASGGAPYDGTLEPEFWRHEGRGRWGGLASARRGFAAGGDPGDDEIYGQGLDIPNDQPQGLSLATPGAPPQAPKSALSQLLGLGEDAAQIAQMIPGLARGGGISSADAEVPDDPAGDDERASLTSIIRSILSNNDDAGAVQQPIITSPGLSVEATTPTSPSAPSSGLAAGATPAPGDSASPTDFNAMMASIAKIEGSGKNPKSSARGPFQIVDPTFVQLFREMFPDRAAGLSKAQILAIRNTPEGNQISGEMGPVYAQQNMGALAAAGIEPNAPNVYLAHFLGPSGAIRLLGTDPSAPATTAVSPLAVKENPTVLGGGKTVADVVAWAQNALARANRKPFRGGGAIRRGFDDGGAPVDTSTDDDAPEPSADDLALAAAAPDPAPAPTPAASPAPASAPAPAPSQGATSGGQHKGFLGALSDPKVFIPILTGLAAMGAAPTTHFGVALAAGLGAGAQAAQQQRQFQLQQTQVGQKGQEIEYYGQATQAQLMEARARMLEAGTQGFNIAMQSLQNRFTEVPTQLGPDGLPMWRDNLNPGIASVNHGLISATDHARLVRGVYQNALARFGGQTGPVGAIGDFGGPDATSGRLPGDNPGGGVAGGNNVHGPVLGSAVPSAGGMEGGAAGNIAGGPGVGSGPGPSLVRPGQGNAPPQRLVVPDSWPIAKKVAVGAYRNPPLQLPPVDKTQINPSDDPDQLEAKGYALWNAGEQDAGKTLLDRATQIRNGQIPAMGANGQPYYGYAQQHQALEAQNAVVQGQAEQKNAMRTEALQFTNEYSQTKQALDALARIYSTQDPERQAPAIADFIGTAASLPGVKGVIPDNWRDVLAGTDEGAKEAMVLSIERAVDSNLLKAPAKALSVTAKAVPGPGLSADARFDLTAQMMGLLQQKKDFFSAWEKGQDNIDKTDQFATDWVNAHPITAYENSYSDRLPFFAGMSKQAMARLNGGAPRAVKSMDEARGLRSGVPVKIPPGFAGAGQIVLAP